MFVSFADLRKLTNFNTLVDKPRLVRVVSLNILQPVLCDNSTLRVNLINLTPFELARVYLTTLRGEPVVS